MKRFLSSLLVLVMLLSCLSVSAAFADTAKTSGVDIVIVLDQSNSMRQDDNPNNAASNDFQGYRFDAAQMLVAMAESKESRVAVVPFNRGVLTGFADTGFVDINNLNSRNTKINSIGKIGGLNGGTDYGEALAYAFNLIQRRSDKTNQPMIVLLTDGKNAPSPSVTKKLYGWDEGRQEFTQSGSEKLVQVAEADALAMEVAQKASEYNIPIYTVALYNANKINDEETQTFRNQLETYAGMTGGKSLDVPSTDADELPRFFAEVFADMIGSSLQRKLEPVLIEGTTDSYRVSVPVLNTSVMEANLFVSTQSVEASSLKLYDPNGNLVNSNESVMKLMSNKFCLYKILTPKQSATGDWELQFKLRSGKSLDNISLNLLYNYDLTFVTKAGTAVNTMSTAGARDVRKTDTLYVESYFNNNATQQPAADGNLYKVRDDANEPKHAWKTIKVTYTLEDATGNIVTDAEGKPICQNVSLPSDLANSGRNRFYTEIKLATLCEGANGTNAFKSGEYRLHVKADGAGLMQETYVPFNVINQAPVSQRALLLEHEVENADNPESFDVTTFEYDFGDGCVVDYDGDMLVYEQLTLNGGSPELVQWELDSRTGKAKFSTIKDGDGRIRHGLMNMELHVADSEGQRLSIPVSIDVNSVQASAEAGSFTVTPDAVTADKNSEVTITAKAAPSGATADMQIDVRVENILDDTGLTNFTPEDIAALQVQTIDATSAAITIPTGNTIADWTVIVGFYYNGSFIESANVNVKVENVAPVSDAEVAAEIPTSINYGGTWFTFLEQDTPAEALTVDMTRLFTDADNEAALTYTAELDVEDEDAPVELSDPAQNGYLTITPVRNGSAVVTITATDGDGETAVVTVEVSTVDLAQKWLMIWAAALIALVVLILLMRAIHWARLPRFPRNTQLAITEGQSIAPTSVFDVKQGKKPECIVNFVGGLAETYQLRGLEQVFIEPMRGRRDGSIKVMMKKPAPGLLVTLETEELLPGKKKALVWAVDQRLYLQPAEGGESINIHLRNISDAVLPEMEGASGWSGAVSDDGLGFGETSFGTGFDTGFDAPAAESQSNETDFGDFGSDNGDNGF